MRFMATLRVLCASGESAPKDIPGVTNRLRIAVMLSTCSIGMGAPSGLIAKRSRRWMGGPACMARAYCSHTS